MTADLSPTDAAIVEELAAELESQFSYATAHATVVLDWREEAELLLPVVHRAQAAALRKAADEIVVTGFWRRRLNARADALDPS